MTSTSNVFISGTNTEWEDVGPGLSRQILAYDDKIMLVKVRFEKGAIGEQHHHHHSQATYVESGSFEMTIGEEVQTLTAGDSFYVPPHAIHGCLCTEPGVLIDVFSPKRDEFLNS